MATHELAILDHNASIESVKVLAGIVRTLRENVFVKDSDYGVIPGTGDKPVLLLPGMEKLLRALNLRAEYVEREKTLNFETGLFYFEYECRLVDYANEVCVSTAIGSANSYESKWRWREQKRVCPSCGKDAINKSKFPPKNRPNEKPGWYCFGKVGGCGAEFGADDPAITGQQIGRVQNPDIADQLNTICKIAQKRALASAIKGAANVSEFFTVDLEDLPTYTAPVVKVAADVVEGEFTEQPQQAQGSTTQPPQAQPPTKPANGASPDVSKEFQSKDVVNPFISHWREQGLTDKNLTDALGIQRWGQWTHGLVAANKRVSEWLNESLQRAADIAEEELNDMTETGGAFADVDQAVTA